MTIKWNEILDVLVKIKSLLSEHNPSTNPIDQKADFLEIRLQELKSLHAAITHSYEQIRGKALALLSGEIALVTFLFVDSNPNTQPIQIVISTAIFYLIGIAALATAFGLFLHIISPVKWMIPPDTRIMKHGDWFNWDKEKYLSQLNDEYTEAISVCSAKLDGKAKKLIFSTYLLAAGIIIIVLLKYGKGVITL